MRRHRQHGPHIGDDGTVTFRVWAPRAERVELVLGEATAAMEPRGDGWHGLRTASRHGDDYAFRLNG
ncbi:MAG: malto-oligosyltrehalose trehalohydrolase, partial [Euzebyales bacterium]|nr:malto-oligosyltrehalose trehalohydrolase [Euzebyales bacterium]